MRKYIHSLIVFVVLSIFGSIAPIHASWFNNAFEKQQINQLRAQVQQQEKAKGGWQIVAFVLGVTCVIALVAGAAIGSKGRRDARTTK